MIKPGIVKQGATDENTPFEGFGSRPLCDVIYGWSFLYSCATKMEFCQDMVVT